MMTIKNVQLLDGQVTDFHIPLSKDYTLDNQRPLLLFPTLIDPHICFGSPLQAQWLSTLHSVIRGGVTTVIDLPSQDHPCESKASLEKKRELVDQQLSNLNIPLNYFLYGKIPIEHIEEMGLAKHLMVGSLLLFTSEHEALSERIWEKIFRLAAWEDLLIVIHSNPTLLEKAIGYTQKESSRLYVLNVATQQEIDLIKQARKRSLLIYAETTPQQLFPKDNASPADALWEALNQGIIDTVGSGYHADSPGIEKVLMPGGEVHFLDPMLLLPLLLTAHHEGKISLEKIVQITRINSRDIFKLEKNEDFVLVDLEKELYVQRIDPTHSREMTIKGWPVYTMIKGHMFSIPEMGYPPIQIEF